MKAILQRLMCIFALAFVFPNPASAQKVALIIANSNYEHTSQLANPEADSALVASALREIGFDTVELESNLDQPAFLKALRDFRALAEGADAAVVYFAGHGVESSGRNWLLPTSAKLDAEGDMPYEAIELDRVLRTLAGAQLRIAILDACRNNPFANRWQGEKRSISRGLAPLEVDDMLVIYAAAPGAFAFDGADGNSPFALALARRIVQPGLPVQLLGGMVRDDVLQATDGEQRPFISASMTGRPLFLTEGPPEQMAFFDTLYEVDRSRTVANASAVKGPALAEAGSPTTGDTTSRDFTFDFSDSLSQLDEFREIAAFSRDLRGVDSKVYQYDWLNALSKDTVQGYREFLREYPESPYTALAEANIAQLLDPTATGGELNSDEPWIISLGAALPNRYAVDLGVPLPIDGIWRISTNDKRLRIERGRAFAVDGWNHALLFRVEPEQVTMTDIRHEAGLGQYLGRDILLNGDAKLTLREDGNLVVKVATFPFPIEFVLIREALDNPEALEGEHSQAVSN